MNKSKALISIALGLVFFYLFVLQVVAIWPFTLDDMYITLRYAKNWVSGVGLLWNAGAPPVEGYSNFLFVCVAALSLKMGFNPVIVLKGFGVLGLFITAVGLYGLSRFWFTKTISLIPVLWLLMYRDEILWVASGLETTVYQALLVFAVYVLLCGLGYQASPKPRALSRLGYWLGAGVLLALAGLTRPEGAFLAVVFLAISYLNLPRGRQAHLYFLSACGIFTFLYGSYFLWRWQYYGLLLPNSVYCKGFAPAYWLTLDKAYLNLAWPFLILGLGACWNSQKTSGDRRHYFLWLPSLVYLVLLARADPVSAMAQRLFLPAFVLLLPLSLLGVKQVVEYFSPMKLAQTPLFIGVAAFWLALLVLPISSLVQLAYFTQNPQSGENLRLQVSAWLKQHVKDFDQISLADSGLIPYLIPAHFEDSYCLNNASMGQDDFSTMFDQFCARILRHQPAVIILSALVTPDKVIYSPADQCLKQHLATRRDYERQKVFQRTMSDGSAYRYEIYTQ